MNILDDNRVLNYRGLYDFLERLKGFFIKNPKNIAPGKYLRCDENGNVEWAEFPTFLTFKGTVTNYEQLPSENNSPGDVWKVESTGAEYYWTLNQAGTTYVWEYLGKLVNLTKHAEITDTATVGQVLVSKSNGTGGITYEWKTLEENTDTQADWNETDTTSAAYINNKPTVPEVLPVGNYGDLYFISQETSNRVVAKQMLAHSSFIETDDELIDLKTRSVSMSEIYNDWTAFAHRGDSNTVPITTEQQEEIANPKNFWTYNSGAGTMVCSKNSVTYLGFVDNKHYVDNYTMQATLSSSVADNDSICLIIAYYKDSSNKEYTLSAVRTRNNNEGHTIVEYNADGTARSSKSIPMWAIVYNYKQSDSRLITYADISGDTDGYWNNTTGTTVKIIRNGDDITCYASPYGSTTLDTVNSLTVDLNSIDVLSVFKGKRQYGVGCFSQQASAFSNITIQLANIIYDVRNGDGWSYNNGTWTQIANKLYTDFEVGRILNCQEFSKSYYIDVPYHIIKINDDSLRNGGTITGQIYQSSSYTGDSAIVTDTKKYNFVEVTSGSSVDFKITKPTNLAGPCEVICAIKNSTSSNLTVNLPYPTTGARTDYMWTGSAYDTNTSVHNMIGESSFTISNGKIAEIVVTYWTGTEASFNGGVES